MKNNNNKENKNFSQNIFLLCFTYTCINLLYAL